MKVRLDVVSGPEAGRCFEFEQADSFLVGRSPRAHLVLDPLADQFISRSHCLLDVRPPRCLLNDLDSTNGTFVNDRRISRAELADGDVIRVGRTTIRVGIADRDARPAPRVLCAVCRSDVTGEVDSRPVDELEGLVYTCTSCQAREQARQRAARQPSQPPAPVQRRCVGCRRDVSRYADADGRAAELFDADYLCPTCAVREKAEGMGIVRLGSYRVLRELGRGGMGVVYKAVHEPTRRVCAVKQILPDAARDDRALRLFDREIGVQSMVAHPNLARVLERGREGSTCFFAVEYLAGGDMSSLVADAYKGPVDPTVACRLILQVLAGLQSLHERGFVHRDLKPPNFLLTCLPTDGAAVAKITDYGLAKSFEEAGNSVFDLTRVGEAGGSLMFMPPEQILEYRFVKPPADVYAVGVSLYYLLTAAYTVDFPTPAQALLQAVAGGRQRNPIDVILEDPPIPIRERQPRLPGCLARVVDRAVQKELARRYQSASELRGELAEAARLEGLG